MKNLLEFNDFKQYKNSNLITEAAGTDDAYFANVKGNMAGAENTLIGSAFLKLFGFIKRKGMQAYLNAVLKPKLGKQYFNNILRYVARNEDGVRPPSEKTAFEVKKIEENAVVGETIRVEIKHNDDVGLDAFVVGATMTKESGEILEDGRYSFIYYIGSSFSIEGGVITKLDSGMSTTQQESKEIEAEAEQVQPEEAQAQAQGIVDSELEKYKDEVVKGAEDSEAEDYIVAECNKIKEYFKLKQDNNKLDMDELTTTIHNLENEINDIKRMGLYEIDQTLENGGLDQDEINEMKLHKKLYNANIAEFIDLQIYLQGLQIPIPQAQATGSQVPQAQTMGEETTVPQEVPQTQTVESNTSLLSYGNKLFEATDDKVINVKKNKDKTSVSDVKSSKLSDELKELNGKVIDFNNKDFYMQFEKEGIKEKVTNIILENKTDIVKLQLQAERIISGNKKLENNWERMVQDVLGKYSKFMITDNVNPIRLKADGGTLKAAEDANKKDSKKEGNTIDLLELDTKLEKVEKFNSASTKLSKISKMEVGDIGMFNASINSIAKLWVYELHNLKLDTNNTADSKKVNQSRMAYRIIGYINDENQKKLKDESNEVTDFSEYVTTNINNLFCDQEYHNDKENGMTLQGIFLIGNKHKYSENKLFKTVVALLYCKSSFDESSDDSYIFKVKNLKTKKPIKLKMGGLDSKLAKNMLSHIKVPNSGGAWKFDSPDSLVKYNKFSLTTLHNKYVSNVGLILPSSD